MSCWLSWWEGGLPTGYRSATDTILTHGIDRTDEDALTELLVRDFGFGGGANQSVVGARVEVTAHRGARVNDPTMRERASLPSRSRVVLFAQGNDLPGFCFIILC